MNLNKHIALALALGAGSLAGCAEKKAEAPATAQAPAAPASAPVVTPAAAPTPAATASVAAAPAAAAPAADPAAEALNIFTTRCATCHGALGKGDGMAAAALNPKPRTFTDKEWQKSVTDEHIEKIILAGGAAVGKSPLMPPNPDLEGKKDVVAALRAHVRKLGQ